MMSIKNDFTLNENVAFRDNLQYYLSSILHDLNKKTHIAQMKSFDDISGLLSNGTKESMEDLKRPFENDLFLIVNSLKKNLSPQGKEDSDLHHNETELSDQMMTSIEKSIQSLLVKADKSKESMNSSDNREDDTIMKKQFCNIFKRSLSRNNTEPYSAAELEDMPTPKFNNDSNQTFTTKIFQSNKNQSSQTPIIHCNQTKLFLECTYNLFKNNIINKRQRKKLKEMIYEKDLNLFSINTSINTIEESTEKLLYFINPNNEQ